MKPWSRNFPDRMKCSTMASILNDVVEPSVYEKKLKHISIMKMFE
jgi:hypothetical protein